MFRVLLFLVLLGTYTMAQSLKVPDKKIFSTQDLEQLIQNKIELGCERLNDKSYYAAILDKKSPKLHVLYLLFKAQDAARCFDRINPQSELLYKEALTKSQLVSTEMLVYAQLQYANYLYYFRDMTRAFNYYLAIDQTLEKGKIENPIRADFTYQSLGYFYGTIGANRESLIALEKALKLSEPSGKIRAAILDAMGNQYFAMGDLENASKWYYPARTMALNSKDELRYAKVLGNQARIELRKQNFDSAESLLQKGIEISIRLEEPMNLMFAKTVLSQLYFEQGKFELAEKNLNDATKLYRSKPYYATNGIAIEKLKLRIYQTTGQKSKLLPTYETILQLEKFIETLDGDKALSNANLLLQKLKWQQAKSESDAKKELMKRRQIYFAVIFILLILLGLYIFKYYNNLVNSERLEHLNKVKTLELENLKVEAQLAHANQNLGLQVRYIKNKNTHVQNLRFELLRAREVEKELLGQRRRDINTLLSSHLMTKENWEVFKMDFIVVHKDFYQALQFHFPHLNDSNFRILFLRKLKMSTSEISQLLGVTPDAVKKSNQRLKKKLGEQYTLLESLLKKD